jgi:hypothetical protein
MSKRVSISQQEAADRLSIRELIEAYAHAPIVAMQRVKWLFLLQTAISWCT